MHIILLYIISAYLYVPFSIFLKIFPNGNLAMHSKQHKILMTAYTVLEIMNDLNS